MFVGTVMKVRNCNGCDRNSNTLVVAEVVRRMVGIVA
jgi:hypothetical protein